MNNQKGNPFALPKVSFLIRENENETQEKFCENCLRALELHDKGFPEAYYVHCQGGNIDCTCDCRFWKK